MYSLEYSTETYISAIEEKLGGKLNLKTLEVEKTQLEFKDGDIVTTDGQGRSPCSLLTQRLV